MIRYYTEEGDINPKVPEDILTRTQEIVEDLFEYWRHMDMAPRDMKQALNHAFDTTYYNYTIYTSLRIDDITEDNS